MNYESSATFDSEVLDGVSFTVRRMSFGRRLRLLSAVRDLATRLEAVSAGTSADDKVEASLCQAQVEALYIEWGLIRVLGLTIDGAAPTPTIIIECGPEALCREIAAAVRKECFLNAEERKN